MCLQAQSKPFGSESKGLCGFEFDDRSEWNDSCQLEYSESFPTNENGPPDHIWQNPNLQGNVALHEGVNIPINQHPTAANSTRS